MESKTRKTFVDWVNRYCSAQKGGEFTHTSIYDPMASFYVPPDKTDKFFQLYKNAVKEGADLYMTEKHRDVGPVVIDLDFRFPYDEAVGISRKYGQEDVQNIIRIYAEAISQYVEGVQSFKVFVMEKTCPVVQKGLIKDGIHILIPDVVTQPTFQLMLRERVLDPLKEALKGIGLSNDIRDVVDEAVIERNNWQMYGSKKPYLDKYQVTQIFTYTMGTAELLPENVSTDHEDYVEVLSIRNKFTETKIKFERKEDLNRYEELVQERKMKAHFKQSVLTKTRNTRTNKIDTEEEYVRITRLVDLLNKERADSYLEWIRVGWCLRNIDHRLLHKWEDFSRQSSKFVEGECERQWDYMRQDGACLGKGTLHLWAKNDNPEVYKEIIQEDLRKLVLQARSGTEYDMALVLQKKYENQFMYDSRNKLWYVYALHRWHETDDGFALKRRLPTEVADLLRECSSYFQSRACQPNVSQEEKEEWDTKIKKIQEVICKLKKTSFQLNVMAQAAMLFQSEKVDERLDTNRHLVGFENGVYDLDAMEFRDGRPDDFLTMSTGINYVEYDAYNPTVNDIKRFFGQVLPNQAVREYVFRLFASFLHGDIREERFNIWTGSGCHALGTPIMMFDGTSKKVEEVVVGDKLMGDDSTERNVKQLFRGYSDMYEIKPAKGNPFVVNGKHVLSLKFTNTISMRYRDDRKCWSVRWKEFDPTDIAINRSKHFATEAEAVSFKANELPSNKAVIVQGDVADMTVEKYLSIKKRIGERNLYLYKRPVEYATQDILLDPYFMGYWLGDGHSCHSSITTADDEVVDYIKEVFKDRCDIRINGIKGNANTYSISKKPTDDNFCCHAELRKMGVINDKHIPDIYKYNSREVRMQLLAGIIDSDGHYQPEANQFEITFKSEKLMDDLIHLARSLGFACYKFDKKGSWTYKGIKKSGMYFRTHIVGAGIEDIPTKLPRKRAVPRIKNKDILVTSFKVNKVEDDNFYGFELDGNHRYMMEDFTVTHNSNGKSKLLELYEKTFGEYCCTLPIALLTQKRGASNSASPELSRARTKRFACLQEPGENERLNIGLMKEMTGGDKMYARGLYKEGGEFKPQFKLVLTCNHLPNVPSDDGGTWRRIRVVRFESRFCESPDPEKSNEYPIDTSLNRRFDDWKEPFMSMLIDYYKQTVTQKIKEPEDVLEYTREYQRRNDIIMEFLDGCVERHETSFMSITDAFLDYKTWLKDEGVVEKNMRKSDFQAYIEKKYGKAVKKKLIKGWQGFRLRSSVAEYNQVDELEAGDVGEKAQAPAENANV
jgi:P4 family phage/plasmid primase-like protien